MTPATEFATGSPTPAHDPSSAAQFDYILPQGAIAQRPIEPRSAARLLVDLDPGAPPIHRTVADLPDHLAAGDVLVVNETRVLPARLALRKVTGGAAEVFLLEREPEGTWRALVRPGRRLPPGTVLEADDGTPVVRIEDRLDDEGTRRVHLLDPAHDHGTIPLPPYIHEPLADPERYQTVYARREGSVAAPTAGLHLTDEVLDAVRAKGVEVRTVDLAVGLGTFRPLASDDLDAHHMHEERYDVPVETFDACRSASGRVVAVGTTTLRALESAARTGELTGRTELFIRPGFDFQVVDVLLTNFHQPKSTLLVLLSAFAGHERWPARYAEALAEGYRFLSFGDAMLVSRRAVTLRIEVTATAGAARAGVVTTARGTFTTPCFMPVGTRASVKALSTQDLEELGFEVMLSNTYHLMLRPGAELVDGLGGIHGFAAWPGHVLTDSGGFQVFSLEPKVDDDGATFRSTYDGSLHRLTPELAVRTQELLGADIQMVLDVCPPLPSTPDVVRLAVERTASWAARAKAAHVRTHDQSLFGIVQGGVDEALRRESARRTVALDFEGYGIGGLSVGESRAEMLPALAAALEEIPDDRPRYLMGVGDPIGIVESIALGVDMFDCVLPTRIARHGSVLTSAGRIQIRNAVHARDPGPLDPTCPCAVCARWSRAYLRHLLQVGEPTALRLLTWHNLAWTLALIHRTRAAIGDGTLDAVRREVSEAYE